MERLASFFLSLTDEVLPLRVQVSLVGQAALHDVAAVVGAGFDRGHAAAVGAVDHLHHGLHALGAEKNLARATAAVVWHVRAENFKNQRYSTEIKQRSEQRRVFLASV